MPLSRIIWSPSENKQRQTLHAPFASRAQQERRIDITLSVFHPDENIKRFRCRLYLEGLLMAQGKKSFEALLFIGKLIMYKNPA
jgi:hypothetical protein